jgi:hypothetical protein
MSVVHDTLGDEILLDLSRACLELSEARTRQAERDTSANRAVLAECHTRMDSLLDMFLESASWTERAHPHRGS